MVDVAGFTPIIHYTPIENEPSHYQNARVLQQRFSVERSDIAQTRQRLYTHTPIDQSRERAVSQSVSQPGSNLYLARVINRTV